MTALDTTPAGMGNPAVDLKQTVPDSVSYDGTRLVEFSLPKEWFLMPGDPQGTGDANMEEIRQAMYNGFADETIFPLVRLSPGIKLGLARTFVPGTGSEVGHYVESMVSNVPLTYRFRDLTPAEVFSHLQRTPREWLNVFGTLFGYLDYNYLPSPETRPRIVLVEHYRLSTFLGAYGAGRTLNTFSLLPGETSKLTMKSYSREENSAKNATSILDSFSQESAQDFERSAQAEQSQKRDSAENFSYHADATAKASWGVASVEVKAGVAGGSNSSREQFAKDLSHATQKHAAKASAKRDIHVNTSEETKTEEGTETSIERAVQNINVSRTLNFVFRQMNQEFITLLHLVDVRIAYFDGRARTRREVPLHQLDSLVEEFINDDLEGADPNAPDERARGYVRRQVLGALEMVLDFEDEPHLDFVEQRTLPVDARKAGQAPATYWQVRKRKTSTYKDETGNVLTVAGVIVAANKHVMRTDGVIVDAALGAGDALDTYSQGLQDEAIASKIAENANLEASLIREQLAQELVTKKRAIGASIFSKIFPVHDPDTDSKDDQPKPTKSS